MSRLLPDGDEWTTDDLAEYLDDDTPAREINPADEIAVAMVILDEMMGDDPAKFQGFQCLYRALKYHDAADRRVTHVEADAHEIRIERHLRSEVA
jgi:hypothetical protein